MRNAGSFQRLDSFLDVAASFEGEAWKMRTSPGEHDFQGRERERSRNGLRDVGHLAGSCIAVHAGDRQFFEQHLAL